MHDGEEYYADAGSGSPAHSILINDARHHLVDADIADGAPRHVLYRQNLEGEITESDTVNTDGTPKKAPHARYYYFGGIAMGDVSNDGTSNVNYAASILDHQKVAQAGGLFRFGQNSCPYQKLNLERFILFLHS